jgi:hypothetical protein
MVVEPEKMTSYLTVLHLSIKDYLKPQTFSIPSPKVTFDEKTKWQAASVAVVTSADGLFSTSHA